MVLFKHNKFEVYEITILTERKRVITSFLIITLENDEYEED